MAAGGTTRTAPRRSRSSARDSEGAALVSTGSDGTRLRWDLGSGTPTAEPSVTLDDTVQVRSADGSRLTRVEKGRVVVRDAATNAELAAFPRDDDWIIHALAFSADGALLAVGANDVDVYRVDRRTKKPLHSGVEFNTTGTALAFLPDGRLVIGGTSIQVVDLAHTDFVPALMAAATKVRSARSRSHPTRRRSRPPVTTDKS